MNVFENLREGKHYHILDEDYKREAHTEFDRCAHICHLINLTDPVDREKILQLEKELFNGNLPENTFLTPPFQIDCACRVFLGKNVFANHGLVMMSVGTITVEDGVMFGPEVGLFTVNPRYYGKRNFNKEKRLDRCAGKYFAGRNNRRKCNYRHGLHRYERYSG